MGESDAGADAARGVLSHYGVKGMRWGVRKDDSAGSAKRPPHEDAVKAKEAKAVVKKSGTEALSNKEFNELLKRMDLEQRYSKLTANDGNVALKLARKGGQVTGKMAGELAKEQVKALAREAIAAKVARKK